MPSLSAWRARSAESCSITSSSSARNIFDASSPSTCVSTTTHARTKLSRTSSPVHVPQRPRDALTQSLCSLDSTMTTGAPVDARRAAMPSYILRRDVICSQHDPSAKAELFDYIEVFYNQERRHSTLGYLSPAQFERAARVEQAAG